MPNAYGTQRFGLKQDGHLYHARQKAGLFIMYRLDPSTPETDQGWVYGTVNRDGIVTAFGSHHHHGEVGEDE